MTYRVSMVVNERNTQGAIVSSRNVATNFAGCTDAEDAKEKAKRIYDVARFKSVEEVR